MEIERKFLVKELPEDLEQYECREIEQGYLNRGPVVRIRKDGDSYYLTYKGKGKMVREEYNLPLNSASYEHLKEKVDGQMITKKRYLIPYKEYIIELDYFINPRAGEYLAEVEFNTEEEALAFVPPSWLGEDVTGIDRYHNAAMAYGKDK